MVMTTRAILVLSILTSYAAMVQAQPQTFSSGSTGADGPLTYAQNLGTVYFPPAGLAQRANNIYNFSTITIGTGTTVRVSGWVINGPVYWLAQSDVTIAGTLDISGQPGHAPDNPSLRAPSEPGAGGYSGGVAYVNAGQPASAGNGPGGGAAPAATPGGFPGNFSGSTYLQPLIGGSGGAGGGIAADHLTVSGGGAGGGAILIASSTKITISAGGAINAQGGSGSGSPGSRYGYGGSGGAVRLVSNVITNSGTVQVGGGGGGAGANRSSGSGIFRFEAFTLTGTLTGALTSTPYNLALPVGGPSTVSVTSVNGTAVNANPFSFPDATITTGSAVPVVISGVNVPSGTTGNLYIYSETAADQIIPFTLAGSLPSTSATVNVPYPSGGSRGFAKAVWTTQ